EVSAPRLLAEMLKQTLYMQALLDDLLTQAGARLATLKINPGWVDLAGLYDALVETFHHPASQQGVTLVADDGGLKVWADPLRLRQILVNLMRNALTHAGELSCLELLAEARGQAVLVIVQDNGRGLDKITPAEAFTAGARGGQGTRGWGLGLTVVRLLAEAHGGDCRLEFSPEGGLRVEVKLPLPAGLQ
ncbi:MAG: HAMP domain-containing histidine kinase, partial [Deltaproteobacteria bacterium]|nr:HAMP domain-containing histidine kinase [Deltaproteobacteria bacterium]